MQNEEINNNNNIESNEVPQAEQQIDTGENVEVVEASNENAPISEENNNENVADIQQTDQAKLDNEAFAKMRVENARLQKEIELQKQREEAVLNHYQQLQSKQAPQQEAQEEKYDPDIDPVSWSQQEISKIKSTIQQLQTNNNIQQAKDAFSQVEQELMSQDPDYVNKKNFLIDKQVELSLIGNPNANKAQLKQEIINNFSINGLTTISNGGNLLDAVNNYASVYNYVSPATQKKPATGKPRAELNLRQINENKATTTGMVGRGNPSGSGGKLTAEQWGKMSLAEQYKEIGKRNMTFNDVIASLTTNN